MDFKPNVITLQHMAEFICGRKDVWVKNKKLKDTQECLEKRDIWEIEKHGTVVTTKMYLAVSCVLFHAALTVSCNVNSRQ
jgi:ribosomal protein L19E